MIERGGTWGEVQVGTTLLSPTGLPLLCTRFEAGWYLLEDRNHHGYKVSPKPQAEPVTILEATQEEAEQNLIEMLGAYRMLDIETEKRVEARQHQWVVPALSIHGRYALDRARDHIDWYHGTYAADAINGGFKNLKEALAAHDEMHTPGNVFTDRPHIHKEA